MKKIYTKKNDAMLFVKIEDVTDSIEVIVFPSTLENTISSWQNDRILAIEGRISAKDNEKKIICSNVKEVDEKLLASMKQYLNSHPELRAKEEEVDELIEEKSDEFEQNNEYLASYDAAIA